MTTTLGDLSDAVVASLKDSGKLGKITAEIRAEIYKILSNDDKLKEKIPVCKENFVINELIREYLQYNGYTNSLSVFINETGQPEEPMNRDFLSHSLEVTPHKHIPILYTITNPNTKNIPPKSAFMKDDDKPVKRAISPSRPPLYNGNNSDSEGFFEIRG